MADEAKVCITDGHIGTCLHCNCIVFSDSIAMQHCIRPCQHSSPRPAAQRSCNESVHTPSCDHMCPVLRPTLASMTFKICTMVRRITCTAEPSLLHRQHMHGAAATDSHYYAASRSPRSSAHSPARSCKLTLSACSRSFTQFTHRLYLPFVVAADERWRSQAGPNDGST
jgi:hypothetical protein